MANQRERDLEFWLQAEKGSLGKPKISQKIPVDRTSRGASIRKEREWQGRLESKLSAALMNCGSKPVSQRVGTRSSICRQSENCRKPWTKKLPIKKRRATISNFLQWIKTVPFVSAWVDLRKPSRSRLGCRAWLPVWGGDAVQMQ